LPEDNIPRRLALKRLIYTYPDLFNLLSAAENDILPLVGMLLPNETVLEINEIYLKKVYWA
jgi:hypothetical protein